MDRFLDSGADLSPLVLGLAKPLRCMWVGRHTAAWEDADTDLSFLPFTPLLCVCVSKSEELGVGERKGWTYVQGAGDDEEGCVPSHRAF